MTAARRFGAEYQASVAGGGPGAGEEGPSKGAPRPVNSAGTAATEPTARVLLVDDDPDVRFLVRRGLSVAGFDLVDLESATAAEEALSGSGFDLVVLDLGLPDADGAELLVRIRRRSDVPVIVLSGMGSEEVRLRCFALGADDYVVKPFYPRELAARAQAVIRRRGVGTSPERPVTEFGRVRVDPSSRRVWVDGEPVHLRARELDLLVHLVGRPGHVCSREDLLRDVWDSSSEWQDADTVTEHLRRLRLKVEDDPSQPRHLVTVRGHGYRFDP